MKNKISIVIVNYNGNKYLEKCISSLLDQTYENFEIIIVDNNSTDNSISLMKKEFRDIRIKYLENKTNFGFAKANNLGIEISEGDFILLLNNDTFVDKDFLENLLNYYLNNSFDVIGPVEYSYDGLKDFDYYSTFDILGYPYLSKNPDKSMYLVGFCLLFKKDFYLKTDKLDDTFFMYFEESDWFWRLRLLGYKFAKAKNIKVYHAGNIQKLVNYKSLEWKNQNNLVMLFKNYSFSSLLFVLPLFFLINLLEIIFFIIVFKPQVSFYYLKSWFNVLINFQDILKKRKWVQENRKLSDLEILKYLYFGSSKFEQFIIKFRYLFRK